MRFFKSIFFSIFFLSIIVCANAQEIETNPQETSTEEVEEDNTLQNQYKNIKEKSNTYQEYKVVKITNLNNFWDNVKDSLEAQKKEFVSLQKEIETQKATIKNLQQQYDIKDAEVQKGDYEKAHINVLGIDILKVNYIYFNIVFITLLILVLVVMYFKYKGSEKVAQLKKNEYESIDKELNDFKNKSRERELKIKRELQTEMNRVQELTHELTVLRGRSTTHN